MNFKISSYKYKSHINIDAKFNTITYNNNNSRYAHISNVIPVSVVKRAAWAGSK